MAMPASSTTVGATAAGASARRCSIFSKVLGSLMLPAKTSLRLGKPLASSTRARVTSGQSERFSLEWPCLAFGLALAVPSKKVLVRSYRVMVSASANRSHSCW